MQDPNLSNITDSDGHGTLCAGVACGDPFQSTFDGSIVMCRGVAPKATLVIWKAIEGMGHHGMVYKPYGT